MKLKLPAGDEGDSSEEIKVKVWTERTKKWLEPPILVQKHELTRWDGQFCFEEGGLLLQDGFCENWNEVNDCISLLKGLYVDVTFDNIKVRVKIHHVPDFLLRISSLSTLNNGPYQNLANYVLGFYLNIIPCFKIITNFL